jgi:hypothetical protein
MIFLQKKSPGPWIGESQMYRHVVLAVALGIPHDFRNPHLWIY